MKKKFVGKVNEKSFDNLKDFSKAALKAMVDNDGVLCISSYYSYDNEDETTGEDARELPKETPATTLKLADIIPNGDPEINEDGEPVFQLSDELKDKLKAAENKDSVFESCTGFVKTIDDSLDLAESESKKLREKIDVLSADLKDIEDNVEHLKARKTYYEEVMDVISKSKNKTSNVTNAKKELKANIESEFVKLLDRFGFWNK